MVVAAAAAGASASKRQEEEELPVIRPKAQGAPVAVRAADDGCTRQGLPAASGVLVARRAIEGTARSLSPVAAVFDQTEWRQDAAISNLEHGDHHVDALRPFPKCGLIR